MSRHVVLLRGVNVGGRNRVPMADLRDALTAAGYGDVSTYIASGNVLVSTTKLAKGLEADIEAVLERRFGFPLIVVVRSQRRFERVVEEAPADFLALEGTHHRDTVFLKAPLTAKQAMTVVRLRDGVDAVWPGTGVLYFARLSAQRQRSLMSKLVGTPAYQQMTIRSWATTSTLRDLL